MKCPNCDDGWVITNPDWPRGDKPYRGHCSLCGGSGEVKAEEAP